MKDFFNTKKTLQVTSLFGPDKARGFLPIKNKKDAKKLRHNVWLAKTRYGYE